MISDSSKLNQVQLFINYQEVSRGGRRILRLLVKSTVSLIVLNNSYLQSPCGPMLNAGTARDSSIDMPLRHGLLSGLVLNLFLDGFPSNTPGVW
jgi:hypothetical protein